MKWLVLFMALCIFISGCESDVLVIKKNYITSTNTTLNNTFYVDNSTYINNTVYLNTTINNSFINIKNFTTESLPSNVRNHTICLENNTCYSTSFTDQTGSSYSADNDYLYLTSTAFSANRTRLNNDFNFTLYYLARTFLSNYTNNLDLISSTYGNNTYLKITDQRYNDTLELIKINNSVLAVNNTQNLYDIARTFLSNYTNNLDLITSTYGNVTYLLQAEFDAEQFFSNYTNNIDVITSTYANNTYLKITDGRYNETLEIVKVNNTANLKLNITVFNAENTTVHTKINQINTTQNAYDLARTNVGNYSNNMNYTVNKSNVEFNKTTVQILCFTNACSGNITNNGTHTIWS